MAAGDTQITITGNLVEDPTLRFTQVSREFAISEGCSAGNRSGGSR
jgi:single-stranded DNA-binding protein